MTDQLSDKRFTQHTDEEIFTWLDAVLYSGEIGTDEKSLERFDFLTNTGEQFDDLKTFIYSPQPKIIKVLYKIRDQAIHSASCNKDAFISVSADLKEWFDVQIEHQSL